MDNLADNWVNAKQISEIAGCGRDKARRILREVNADAKAKGFIIPTQSKAYRPRVLAMLGIIDK